MAEIQFDGDRLNIPRWMAPVLLVGLLTAGTCAVKTWAATSSNTDKLVGHDTRLTTVEGKIGQMQQDVAVVRQQMSDQRQHDKELSDKIDRILSLELARDRAR